MRKDQIELHVGVGVQIMPPMGINFDVGPIEIRRPGDELRRLVPSPRRRAVPLQAKRLAAFLVEVAEHAGRDRQIEAQRRRDLRKPAEIDVALVQPRRQIGVFRPLQKIDGEAGRDHQRRVDRRTRQREDALQLQIVRRPCRSSPPGASQVASKSAFWKKPFRTPGGSRGSPGCGVAGATSPSPGDCRICDDELGCDTSCPGGDCLLRQDRRQADDLLSKKLEQENQKK